MTSSSPAAVTVIVPGFDVAEYAVEALESLVAQTREDWTAILVDDASTDATAKVFARFAEHDRRFQVLRHDSQRGLGAARNTALDAAETEFVAFLDADDVMRPRALERLVGTLEQTGSDFVAGAYVRLRPDSAGGYEAGSVQPWVRAATAPERRGITLAVHPQATGNIVAWSKVSRRELWQREGLRFPVGKAYEDQIVAQLMYTRARAFDVIPDVVVEWRERADGTSITQHKAELSVMRDYLEALRDGVRVLDDAGKHAAAASRIPLILTLDLPPLVALGAHHVDETYRRELGEYARELADRLPASDRAALGTGAVSALETATAW